MAKFFLFVFTVLLSLSLGLFVGQNYLLEPDSSAAVHTDENAFDQDKSSVSSYIRNLVNQIFANDEIAVGKIKEGSAEVSENQINDQEELKNIKSIPMHQGKDEPIKFRDQNDSPAKNIVVETQKVKKVVEQKPAVENPISAQSNVGPNFLDGWVIQVAAFQDVNDALKIKTKIVSAGYPNYVYKTEINGKFWFRVNVGPFRTVTEATNYKQTQKVHLKFKGAFVRKL